MLLKLAFPILFIYISICLFLFVFQKKFIYFPQKEISHQEKVFSFNNDNEIIKVVVLNEGKDKSILYFGGNAENVVFNSREFKDNFKDYTIYMLNYRGYAGSTGEISEKNEYSDAQKLYDLIKNKHKEVNIIGRSIGSGIATYIASNNHINKLILITPYDSIENIVKDKYPIFPISIILTEKFESIKRINNISSPILILIAETDNVIKHSSTYNLINSYKGNNLEHFIIKDTNHNNINDSSYFFEKSVLFLCK